MVLAYGIPKVIIPNAVVSIPDVEISIPYDENLAPKME